MGLFFKEDEGQSQAPKSPACALHLIKQHMYMSFLLEHSYVSVFLRLQNLLSRYIIFLMFC